MAKILALRIPGGVQVRARVFFLVSEGEQAVVEFVVIRPDLGPVVHLREHEADQVVFCAASCALTIFSTFSCRRSSATVW